MLRTTCYALAVCFAGSAAAQSAARPAPAEPKASAPARPYESVFKDYKPHVDPEVARWRESNEEMGRLGGHLGHLLREAGATTKPSARPSAPMSHGGHK